MPTRITKARDNEIRSRDQIGNEKARFISAATTFLPTKVNVPLATYVLDSHSK